MSKAPCSHCGMQIRNPTHGWELKPCVLGKKLKGWLCDDCDIYLNDHVIRFFHVPDAGKLMRDYRAAIMKDKP